MTKFSTALSKAISDTGLSLRKVSERIGLAPSFLSKLSTGGAGPSDNALRVLCERLTPSYFPELDHDWSKELLIAHLEDTATASGLDLSHLKISLDADQNRRFVEFSPSLADTLYILGKSAQADPQFASMLERLEDIGLRIQAQHYDEQQATARRRKPQE